MLRSWPNLDRDSRATPASVGERNETFQLPHGRGSEFRLGAPIGALIRYVLSAAFSVPSPNTGPLSFLRSLLLIISQSEVA